MTQGQKNIKFCIFFAAKCISTMHFANKFLYLKISLTTNEDIDVQLHTFLTLALHGGERSDSWPGCFISEKVSSTEQETEWAHGAGLNVFGEEKIPLLYPEIEPYFLGRPLRRLYPNSIPTQIILNLILAKSNVLVKCVDIDKEGTY